jgi:hypothetical protein
MTDNDSAVRPGESSAQYIKRMHGPRGCNCPPEYSRCRFAVRFDEAIGYKDRGHGGWGWSK